MNKALIDRELLERILGKMSIVWQRTDETEELREILAQPAADCEFHGDDSAACHQYSGTQCCDPAADCGLEVVAWQDAENPLYTTGEKRQMHGWATDGYPIVELIRKSDADARDAMRLERIKELEAKVAGLNEELNTVVPELYSLQSTRNMAEKTVEIMIRRAESAEAELATLKAQEQIGEIYDVDGVYMAIWANGTPDVGTKLYAAPVTNGVVMPERIYKPATRTEESFGYRNGWNDCLDEVARLNGGQKG